MDTKLHGRAIALEALGGTGFAIAILFTLDNFLLSGVATVLAILSATLLGVGLILSAVVVFLRALNATNVAETEAAPLGR